MIPTRTWHDNMNVQPYSLVRVQIFHELTISEVSFINYNFQIIKRKFILVNLKPKLKINWSMWTSFLHTSIYHIFYQSLYENRSLFLLMIVGKGTEIFIVIDRTWRICLFFWFLRLQDGESIQGHHFYFLVKHKINILSWDLRM